MSLAFPKPEPQEKRPPQGLRRTRLRPRSRKEGSRRRAYNKRVKEWLPGRRCVVFPQLAATQVHHAKGRDGELLFDERYWRPVSAKGQRYVHAHPEEAYAKGWSVRRSGDGDAG